MVNVSQDFFKSLPNYNTQIWDAEDPDCLTFDHKQDDFNIYSEQLSSGNVKILKQKYRTMLR